MAESEALAREIGAGWSIVLAGLHRSRDHQLTADVIAQNGRPVHSDRIAIDSSEARAAWALAAAGVSNIPAEEWAGNLLELVPEAELELQSAGGVRGDSAATRLVNLVTDLRLFHDGDQAYAALQELAGQRVFMVGSREFRGLLQRRHRAATDAVASPAAIQSTVDVLAAEALDGPQEVVNVRVAEHEGAIYLDLAQESVQVLRIDADGWDFAPDSPVLFYRPKSMRPLPVPARPGMTLDDLWPLVNVPAGDPRRLVEAWLLGALHPSMPYPVLVINGEHGSAKTWTASMLKSLIDPCRGAVRSAPRAEQDLFIAATRNHVLVFDNLSSIPLSLSDALCRLATGGTFATRTFYTNTEETTLEARRPVILTGIEELATREDLRDRCVLLELPFIPDSTRRPEHELTVAANGASARILASLLDRMSQGLRNQSRVRLRTMPRMADFGRWIEAVAPGPGEDAGPLLTAYDTNRGEANELTLEASPLVAPLRTLLERQNPWTGTPTELLQRLTEIAGHGDSPPHEWPATARKLSGSLKRLAPNLRAAGITWTKDRTGKGRKHTFRMEDSEKPSQRSQQSQMAKDRETSGDGTGDGSTIERSASDQPSLDLSHRQTEGDGSDGSDGVLQESSSCPECACGGTMQRTGDGYQCHRCGDETGPLLPAAAVAGG